MSAFKQKLARLGATAGVLAASTAAFMAVGGVTAGSALATTCVTGSTTLEGQGSTLQKVSQAEWNGAYNTACVGKTQFKYTGTGSGAALKAFGFTGGAAPETAWAYVGTDEAPPLSEINEVETRTGVAPVVLPVAQTSIAIVANKPSACVITNGITYTDLNKLFNGELKKWSEISTMSAANKEACAKVETGNITRVVRKDGSGTTYQFKNYLGELHSSQGAAEPGKVEVAGSCVTKNWDELRPNATLNLVWPESNCNTGVTNVERVEGGGGVVNFVKANANTIGYAAYSDVFTNGAVANAVPLENKHAAVNTFAKPGKVPTGGTEESEANCGSRTYEVPSNAFSNGGLGVDWSEVFGANPSISGTEYPLCTLTFDIGWNGYSGITGTGGTKYAANVGSAVAAYFGYELGTGSTEGQTILGKHGYEKLPTTTENKNNVLGAANVALGSVE
jgi:ABC-type phosphate transport system substrate-binding protein